MLKARQKVCLSYDLAGKEWEISIWQLGPPGGREKVYRYTVCKVRSFYQAQISVFARYKFQCKKTCQQFITELKVLANDCAYTNADEMV